MLPPEIVERFASRRANLPQGAKVLYKPAILGQAKMHYAQTTAGVDTWQDVSLLLPVAGPLPAELWSSVEEELESPPDQEDQPEAGASFARVTPEVVAPATSPSPAPVTVARTDPAPAPIVRVAAPPSPPPPTSGPWRVQLGAFSVQANAERLWNELSGRAELAGRQRLLVPAGRVVKLQAGGFATRSAADAACRSLRAAGRDCLVTDR